MDLTEQLALGSHPDQLTQQVGTAEQAPSGSADGSLSNLQLSLDAGMAGHDASHEDNVPGSSLPPGPGPMQRLMDDDDIVPESSAAQPSMEADKAAAGEGAKGDFQPDPTLPSTQAASEQGTGSLQPTAQSSPDHGETTAFQPDSELPSTLPTDEHTAEAGPAATQKLNSAEMPSRASAGMENATATGHKARASASSPDPLQPAAMTLREQDRSAAPSASTRENAAISDEGSTEAAGAGAQPAAARELPQGGQAVATQPDAEAAAEEGGAGNKPAAAKGSAAVVSAAPAKPRSATRRVRCLSQ